MEFEFIYGLVFPIHIVRDEDKCMNVIIELSMYQRMTLHIY